MTFTGIYLDKLVKNLHLSSTRCSVFNVLMNLFKTEGYYTFSPVFLEITPRYTGFRTVLKEPVGTAGARLFYRPDANRVCHPKNSVKELKEC